MTIYSNKTIVISAVNINEAGPLSVLKDCLQFASANLAQKYTIIALTHNKRLFSFDNIIFVEFPKAKKSWLLRLYYEYIYFRILSRKLKPYLWFSLHDITPSVTAEVQAVYCHNPSPFYPFSFKTFKYSYKISLFNLFYKYLYGINIRKNKFVVVQQSWIRSAFECMYGVGNVVVAHPDSRQALETDFIKGTTRIETTFLFPAFPRFFKNFEVVAEAAKILHSHGCSGFKVLLTITGNENKYARQIACNYGNVHELSFIGFQSRDDIHKLYQEVDCLVFPSRLETWGLPISEFKMFRKPMLLADLPYAHETVGDYADVSFFDHEDPYQLAQLMKGIIDCNLIHKGNQMVGIKEPFARSWSQLFDILLKPAESTED